MNGRNPFPGIAFRQHKNKKIMGATKTVVDGIKFDSKLEAFFYSRLKMFKVEFEMQKVYELQPKFRFHDENIRAIEMVVDFYLPKYNVIIDTKGWQTADNKIKVKMLKHHLNNRVDSLIRGRVVSKTFDSVTLAPLDPVEKMSDLVPAIFLPKNQKECDNILIKLKIIK